MGRESLHFSAVEQFLQYESHYYIEELHQSDGFGGSRFSVLIRRINGGVIMINIDAQEQEEIVKKYGSSALLAEFFNKSIIHFVLRKKRDAIQEQFGESEPAADWTSSGVLLSKQQCGRHLLYILRRNDTFFQCGHIL